MQRDNLFNGMLLGAGLMYYLDPDKGRRRRAMIRDQMVHVTHKAHEGLDTAARDMRNRARGVAAETVSRIRTDSADDAVVEARVRSALGRLSSHPAAIQVRVSNGEVSLHGPVLSSERERVVAGVRAVRGVKRVINDLQVHARAGDIPGLQGHGRTPQSRIDVLQENWAPATRLIMGVVGGTMAVRGFGGRGPLSSVLGLTGLGILSRALTNLEMKRLIGLNAGRRAVDFHKIVTIQAPVEEVFDFWSNFENFPRFMSHLREVRNTGENRSHWVAEGPAGLPFDWDAEMTVFEPNRLIGWRSIGSSPIENSGLVRFQSAGENGTRIDIHMSYNPPAGALGHAVASFLGADPKHLMDRDLVQLKSLLERGKTTAHHQRVIREDVRRAIDEGNLFGSDGGSRDRPLM